MPQDKRFYPDDFPPGLTGANTGENTIQSALERLEQTAISSSLRLVGGRRITAISAIRAQNKQVTVRNTLMPVNAVGNIQRSPAMLGKRAYIPGTQGLQIFSYSNETFVRSSFALPQDMKYPGNTGNTQSGKICGGQDVNTGRPESKIVKIKYEPQETVSRVKAELSGGLGSMLGQMGDRRRGLLLGGYDVWYALTRVGQIYDHDTDTITSNAQTLTALRFAPHGGLSSRTAGYVMGGSDVAFAGNLLNSIERITYSGGMSVASPISSILPWSHVVSAKFSEPLKGYLLGGGGALGSDGTIEFASNVITRFNFNGETTAIISQTLPNPLTCSFGGGSSSSGYVFTGFVGNDFQQLTNSGIFKMDFASETSFLVNQRLLEEAWDTGAISDYSPGFY